MVPKRPKVTGTIDRTFPVSAFSRQSDSASYAEGYMTLFITNYGGKR
ncbi:MAG: hypothetical protein ABSB80_08860 [Methanoregula sp.]|jgi:hypothetical protein